MGGRVNFAPCPCLSGPHVLTYPTTYAPGGGSSITALDPSLLTSGGYPVKISSGLERHGALEIFLVVSECR